MSSQPIEGQRQAGFILRSPRFWGVCAVILLGLAAWCWQSVTVVARTLAHAQTAYDNNDWETALNLANSLGANNTNPDVVRLRLRCEARQGQWTPLADMLTQNDPDTWSAADFLALSAGLGLKPLADARAKPDVNTPLTANNDESLTGKGLAWLSWETARRLDPNDTATARTFAGLFDQAGPPPFAARLVEHLTAIPNAHALGLVVLGLLALEPMQGTGLSAETTTMVLGYERSALLGIGTTRQARSFIARLFLEHQKPSEARSWLPPEAQRDAEGFWLASRSHLQEGDTAAAGTAMELADGFDPEILTRSEPSPYVGALACAECHAEEYRHQQTLSAHSQTVTLGDALADPKIPLPPGPIRDPHRNDVTHNIVRQGKQLTANTQVGDQSFSLTVDAILGSGVHGQTMIGKTAQAARPDRTHKELRLSYYAGDPHLKGPFWDVTSGFTPLPGAPADYLGLEMDNRSINECLHCHTTRYPTPEHRPNPERLDHGIGCERCHGPGGHHVAAVNAKLPDLAVAVTAHTRPDRRLRVCAECHSESSTIPPSDPEYVRFQVPNLRLSRCYLESNGKLDCVTCHDPHKKLEKSAKPYETQCLKCHNPAQGQTPCKVNPVSDCIRCHMPSIPNVLPHTSYTDHWIRVHRP